MPPHPDLCYLDNAATSWPKPPQVARAMTRFLDEAAGNPGRGGHAMARAAAEPVEQCREQLARLINAPCPRRVVLTHGCTDSVNLAVHGVLRAARAADPGHTPRVITTVIEHNAVSRTLQCYRAAGEIDLVIVPCDHTGLIDPERFLAACTECTVLACLSHASNVLGTIQPVRAVAQGLRRRAPSALFMVDAAQTLGHAPIDVVADDIDLLPVAGHKGLLGPTATGALYVSERAYCEEQGSFRRVYCHRRGGTGAVAPGLEMPDTLPDALEAGTSNAVGFAGLLAAIHARDPHWHHHELRLTARLLDGLRELDAVTVYGLPTLQGRTPVIAFNIHDRPARDVAAELDARFHICARGGTHCAPMLHDTIGTGPDGAVRVSPGWATTDDDVDCLLRAVRTLATAAAPQPAGR